MMDPNIKETISQNVVQTIPSEELITFVVPLYGYTKERGLEVLSKELIGAFLYRLRSFLHNSQYVFVAEKNRVNEDILNLIANNIERNRIKIIETESYSYYSDYLKIGLEFASEELKTRYIICASPWIILGKDTVDVLLERINKTDVGVCSAYDVRKDGVNGNELDTHMYSPCFEYRAFDINLFALTKSVADQMIIDPNYKTKKCLESDIYQIMGTKNYNVISSQYAPFYSLDIDWSVLESRDEEKDDKMLFQSKWGYSVIDK